MAKSKPESWVTGRWVIESMDQWDRDYIDAEVPGYFAFDARASGDFQFGYVQGQIDYRLGERDGKCSRGKDLSHCCGGDVSPDMEKFQQHLHWQSQCHPAAADSVRRGGHLVRRL